MSAVSSQPNFVSASDSCWPGSLSSITTPWLSSASPCMVSDSVLSTLQPSVQLRSGFLAQRRVWSAASCCQGTAMVPSSGVLCRPPMSTLTIWRQRRILAVLWLSMILSFMKQNTIVRTGIILNQSCVSISCFNQSQCRYYTDPDMLDRIPWMFLILGCLFALLGALAVLLISEPDETPSETLSLKSESENVEVVVQKSYSPTEVLKTATFYQVNKLKNATVVAAVWCFTDVLLTILLLQIWIGFFSIGLCNGLMSTYSKTFGLTFINDDHYYAILAIFLNIFNGSCRIFWGFSYDKLGFKMCFLVIAAAVTVVTACLPALPQTLSKSQSYKTTSINNNPLTLTSPDQQI